MRVPYKDKLVSQENVNRARAGMRSPGGCAGVRLKSWRILLRLRYCSLRVDRIVNPRLRENNLLIGFSLSASCIDFPLLDVAFVSCAGRRIGGRGEG